ncbi:MAG: di-trans,poly-cis-decaprenylcistransferase [Nitrospirae bacterium GWC2_57_13]|nr:MAG: di-trans,poly-cis-decaprenylcistransferase [Nitrospirae bacterium GWC1_57_7]OGW28432.1 MAG: di-trans,poly-cis-decaprenylcistransferase [Nitrospirae bacterium GWC2_57_13]OGW43037.1 MAG: di-trans,poly-cis-decaprenylcistransferase [Nitrospirae bacterium GWD2_57_8]
MKNGKNIESTTVEELISRLDKASLPQHVAIIMDGNGRWAERRGLPRIAGHKKGADVVRSISEDCRRIGIPVLTLYAFSDENWGRPKQEVSFLMEMLEGYLKKEISTMKKNGIRLMTIGQTGKLPLAVQEWIKRAKEETAGNKELILNLALSYSSRREILDAVTRMLTANGSAPAITEESFAAHLDTAGLPDPDLIIRTSGERRISNFLLWQAAYAELYFTETLWPDFSEEDLVRALLDFQGRQRRFGLVEEQMVKKP